MHGLLRCNINTGVHAHARSGRVTQRCHNSPRWEMGLQSSNDVTHRKRAGDLGRFWKSQWVELRPTSGEDGWLSLARGGLGQVSHEMGVADEKARIERLCISLLMSKKPLNSKVIKSFVPVLRIRNRFSCFEIPMFYVIHIWTLYIHFTHSRIWLCNIIIRPHAGLFLLSWPPTASLQMS